MHVTPYLNFNGNCEEAFKFYAQVLGGKIEAMIPHEGTPAASHVPAAWQKKIMHARISIGDQLLMGSDAQQYDPAKGMSVTIGVKSPQTPTAFSTRSRKTGRFACPSRRRSGQSASVS